MVRGICITVNGLLVPVYMTRYGRNEDVSHLRRASQVTGAATAMRGVFCNLVESRGRRLWIRYLRAPSKSRFGHFAMAPTVKSLMTS